MSFGGEEGNEEQEQADLNLAPVVRFLVKTLEMKVNGDSAHYDKLVRELVSSKDAETLWRLYVGLADCVTIVSGRPHAFRELVHALFRFDWSGREPQGKIVRAYVSLVVHLVSVNGTYLLPAMHMLVRNMVARPAELTGSAEARAGVAARQAELHRTLRRLLALAPAGCSQLYPVLADHYPHQRLPAEALADYAAQALTVTRYVPLLQDRVLSLVIQRCLELDVEIKITDQGQAVIDDTEDEDNDAIFSLEDEAHGVATTTLPGTKETTVAVDEMAEKLDCVMTVLFTHISEQIHGVSAVMTTVASPAPPSYDGGAAKAGSTADGGPDRLAAAAAAAAAAAMAAAEEKVAAAAAMRSGWRGNTVALGRLFRAMSAIFEEQILMTHRSKFVQYVMFYICGQVPQLSQLFVRRLLEIALDRSVAGVTRQSALAYAAGFVSRGAFVPSEVVSEALSTLLDHVAAYADDHDTAAAAADAAGGLDGASPWRPAGGSHFLRRKSSTPGRAAAAGSAFGAAAAARAALVAGGPATPGAPALARALSAGTPQPGTEGFAGEDHLLFYSMCQAAFYIMCFRAGDALDVCAPRAAAWERVLASSLQPLRHCLDSVRREFARLCCLLMGSALPPPMVAHLREVSAEAAGGGRCGAGGGAIPVVVQPGAALGLGAGVGGGAMTKVGGLGRGSNPLDSFFPFDPYLLKRSHAFVVKLYNHWQSIEERHASRCRDAGEEDDKDDDDDDNDSEAETDDEDESPDERVAGRPPADAMVGSMAEKFASSLISEMSVTPLRSPAGVGSADHGNGRCAGIGSVVGGCGGGSMAMSLGAWDPGSWGGSIDHDNDAFHEDVSPPPSPLGGPAAAAGVHGIGGGGARRSRRESIGDELW